MSRKVVLVPISYNPHEEEIMTKPRSYSQNLEIFGFDIARYPTLFQFILLAGGVFGFYVIYGYYQEYLFLRWKDEDVHLGWFLTLFQFITYSILSLTQQLITLTLTSQPSSHNQSIEQITSELLNHNNSNDDHSNNEESPNEKYNKYSSFCQKVNKMKYTFFNHQAPLKDYFLISFCSVATIGLSNAACEFLNYPTQVVFKCCKLIPVMVLGIFILKKTYTFVDYFAAILFCLGLIICTLADKYVSPSFNFTGITLISLALIADAFIGNLQEKVFKEYKSSAAESLFFVKGIGCFYLIIIVMLTNQLISGIEYCFSNVDILMPIIYFSISGWFGENFVMLLVKKFGAVATVTTTSARKAITIIFSFIMFPKPFTHAYTAGFFLIFLAIAFEAQKKRYQSKKSPNNL